MTRADVRLEFGLRINAMTLYNGHRSFYASLTIGRRWVWVQRWDVERAPRGRFRSRDGLMGWAWGISRVGSADTVRS